MQLQPIGRRDHGRAAIKPVAEDRVTDGLHVDPQLVAAAGQRAQFDAGRRRFARQNPPIGARRFSAIVIDHLQRTVRPVDDQRQVDAASVLGQHPVDPRQIGFFGFPPFELQPQMPLRRLRAGECHDAGGVHIQPVHQQCLRVLRPDAQLQTIPMLRRLARNRQQAGRLVEHQQGGILMDHPQGRLRRGVDQRFNHGAL
jgi:hypothetical protein